MLAQLRTCGLDELFAVTVPRTTGASVVPTLTASANGASATLRVELLWSAHTTMSIRSLAAALTASIFVQGLHIEPVTSSIREISTLLPPPPLPVQASLGHSAAVAVVVTMTHPKPLLAQAVGAPCAASLVSERVEDAQERRLHP